MPVIIEPHTFRRPPRGLRSANPGAATIYRKQIARHHPSTYEHTYWGHRNFWPRQHPLRSWDVLDGSEKSYLSFILITLQNGVSLRSS